MPKIWQKSHFGAFFWCFFLFSSGPQVNLGETRSNLYDQTQKSTRAAKLSGSRAKNSFLGGKFSRIFLLNFLLI